MVIHSGKDEKSIIGFISATVGWGLSLCKAAVIQVCALTLNANSS